MKGLFSVIGLIAALFVSGVQASIYDNATSQAPKRDKVWHAQIGSNPFTDKEAAGVALKACKHIYRNLESHKVEPLSEFLYKCSALGEWNNEPSWYSTDVDVWAVDGEPSCPPDDYPLYIVGVDSNDDNKVDACYNPAELDEASDCASDFNAGTMLAGTSSSPDNVCYTKPDGGKCGYSKSSAGSNVFYQGNLELSCFGDGDEIPPYDETPPTQPQPDECVPYGAGYACSADPSEQCDANGVCNNGCGYVNDQFICFKDEPCTGPDCDVPPVNCETTPNAPVCTETPPPVDCSVTPNDPSCTNPPVDCSVTPNDPSCSDGGGTGPGGGGSDFVLDYQKLGDLMKDAASLLIDESEVDDGTAIKTQIEEGAETLNTQMDDFNNNSLFEEIAAVPQQNIFAGMESMLPAGASCSPIPFYHDASIDVCRAADKLRPILYFVFAFITLIYLRNLLSATIRATGAQ